MQGAFTRAGFLVEVLTNRALELSAVALTGLVIPDPVRRAFVNTFAHAHATINVPLLIKWAWLSLCQALTPASIRVPGETALTDLSHAAHALALFLVKHLIWRAGCWLTWDTLAAIPIRNFELICTDLGQLISAHALSKTTVPVAIRATVWDWLDFIRKCQRRRTQRLQLLTRSGRHHVKRCDRSQKLQQL